MDKHNSNKELIQKIIKLKEKCNAVILAHNYQIGEVQDIADYTGDSLGLSQVAAKTDADVIVFCGVRFMAETASILSPDKTVLLPNKNAGCPMAKMITRDQIIQLKKEHPNAVAVGYVNSTAEVKAELDICCTSSNAVKIIESLKDKEEIIFVPDKYLGTYAGTMANRKLIVWNGYCPTHAKILPDHIIQAKKEHPNAVVLIHPECTPEAIKISDHALSTAGMSKIAKESDAQEFIIATEIGMVHRLQKDNPTKKFYPVSNIAVCPNMKLTSLETVLWSLENMQYEVKVDEEIREKAKKAVNMMLQLA